MASSKNNNVNTSKQLKQNKIIDKIFGFKKVSPIINEINVQKQIEIDTERQKEELMESKLKNEEKQLYLLERAKAVRAERVAINQAIK